MSESGSSADEPEAQPAPTHRLDPDRAAADAAGTHRLDPDRAAADAAGTHRLDPDRAAADMGARAIPLRQPVIDTRRYRWMIGVFGLALVILISIYMFVSHGVANVGVPAGQRLHFFSAPLADTTLNGDANLNPPCTLAGHDPRALNICLVVQQRPLVLGFFALGSSQCEREVDAMQTLSREFPAVKFAAIAVNSGHSATAAAVRKHGWTIPVAYDRDGAVGYVYGIETCPMLELTNRGGVVAQRLVGDDWTAPAVLAAQVRTLR